MKTLFIISGGTGSEREVSLSSGLYCMSELDTAKMPYKHMVVEKDGTFTYQEKSFF